MLRVVFERLTVEHRRTRGKQSSPPDGIKASMPASVSCMHHGPGRSRQSSWADRKKKSKLERKTQTSLVKILTALVGGHWWVCTPRTLLGPLSYS